MAKGPTELIVEGKNINEMTWPTLQKHVVEMTEALILERGERTKTRKECDIMRTCWQNSEKHLEESKAKLLKKYLEGDVLWDKHTLPYAEIEQEITYQNFIVNYDSQFQEKENQKRMDLLNKKWEAEVLPEMMEAKTNEALRFDQKQKELNKEYRDVQKEYEKILEDNVRVLDEKLLDWRVNIYQRQAKRKQYTDFQFLLKQLSFSEQKNLLIHDLNEAHKINFEKTRSFIRERIESDTMQILSLIEEITRSKAHVEETSEEIEHYSILLKRKQDELEELNKAVNICELKLTSYKQNIDKAYRCSRQMEKLNNRKANWDKRRAELEKEVKKRMKEKQMYTDLMANIHNQVSQLQTKFFEHNFEKRMQDHMKNMADFDDIFAEYGKQFPKRSKTTQLEFIKQKKILKELPYLITKEIKGHNEFIESVMVKLCELGLQHVPTFVRVTNELFPTGTGPANLTKT